MTPGLTKRKLKLRLIEGDSSDTDLIITHVQNTRWEDDNATADDDHFEDTDILIK